MKKQSIFRRVYNYFAKKWLIASIVAIIPCIIAIIDYVYNKDISLWGKIGLITLSLLSICFIILKNYGTKEDIQKCVNADRYYKVILEQAMRLKKTDASTMMKILENENPDAFFKKVHLEDRLIPKMHIERYCNKLINLLAESFGTSYDDVGISIVYKELCDAGDRSNTWQLLYNSQLDRDIDYREVINSTLSTFSAVIETPGLYYFKEKINAERDGRYIQAEGERGGNLNGSIYCQNISICGHKKVLPILFTVTTYNSKICSDNEENDVKKAVTLFKLIGDNIAYEVFEYYLYVSLGLEVEELGGKENGFDEE